MNIIDHYYFLKLENMKQYELYITYLHYFIIFLKLELFFFLK